MANKNLPKDVTLGGETYTFRLMTADDEGKIRAFAKTLSEADLWFMRRDITQPETVTEWIDDLKKDRAKTIPVERDDKIVAYGSIY